MAEIKTYEINRDIILKDRYLKWSKVILLIAMIYFVWTIIVVISIYFLEMGYRWSILSMDEWMYTGCFILGFFIMLELILFSHYYSAKKKRLEKEKLKPLYHKGKRVHIYTNPDDIKGGIFSKTYVPIDENNTLRLRTQMIPPEHLWKKKEG